MKKLKISLILFILILFILSLCNCTFAQTIDPVQTYKIVKLRGYSTPSRGYSYGNGNESTGRYLWNIVRKNSESSITLGSFYCIHPNAGFGATNGSANTSGEYNAKFDLDSASDRTELSGLVSSNTQLQQLVAKAMIGIDNVTIKDKFNLFFIPSTTTSANNQLEAIEFQKKFIPVDDRPDNNSEYMTTDAIMAIQQLYIYRLFDSTKYNPLNAVSALKIFSDEDCTDLHDYPSAASTRHYVELFWNYLNNTNKSDNSCTLSDIGNQVIYKGSNVLLGPIKIDSLAGDVTLDLSVTKKVSGVDTPVSFTLANESGTNFTGSSISNILKAHIGQDVYIKVGIEDSSVDVKLDARFNKISKELYINTTGVDYQPFVEIKQKQEDIPKTQSFTIVNKEFDLALRKYITKIESNSVSTNINDRNPNIDYSTIATTKTATYKHKKDPINVRIGDFVTYTITIYNEGEEKGYASKIVDQLPTYLKFIECNSSYYTASYAQSTNKVTFTAKSGIPILDEFDTENNVMKSTSIEVKCQVLDGCPKDKILTNVAYISEEINTTRNITITNIQGQDRDSEPETCPNNTKDNLDDYKGNDSNKSDLTDSTYFYKGQQDDDDFEKVKVIDQIFDLSLRKYITKVESNSVVTNIDDRIPDIDYSTIETTKTATYMHKKNPINVKIGDYITYTITVYNEGEEKGYASRIVDQLPTYLKFIECNSSYYTASYAQSTNKVTFTAKSSIPILDEFDSENNELKSTSIEVKCQVLDGCPKDKILTNVAYISEEINTTRNIIITNTQGQDRDSEPETCPNNTKDNLDDYKGNDSNKSDLTDSTYFYKGQQDDDDFEKVKVINPNFDLSLRKHIISVKNPEETTQLINRAPEINTTDLLNGNAETAIYNHRKDPVKVKKGAEVTYRIQIFNEGEQKGYASEIKDKLPSHLKFDRIDTTSSDYYELSTYNYNINNLLVLRAKSNIISLDGFVTTLSSNYVDVVCIVQDDAQEDKVMTNVAWISKAYNSDENLEITDQIKKDRDSEPATSPNVVDANLENYKGKDNKDQLDDPNYYYKGQQDDDDFEKIIIKSDKFDLALRKYITKIDATNINDRRPNINVDTIATVKTAEYKHKKNPLEVQKNSLIEYTIDVYNEGNVRGYAKTITDILPRGIKFIEVVSGDYTKDSYDLDTNILVLAKTNNNYLDAFNGTTLAKNQVVIRCQVDLGASTITSDKIFTNVAYISQAKKENLSDIIINQQIDQDSEPGSYPNVDQDLDSTMQYTGKDTYTIEELDNSNIYFKGEQDDDDFEKVILKYKPFDLKLIKRITQVDGKDITNRIQNEDFSLLNKLGPDNRVITTGNYTLNKEPVLVSFGSIVKYTLRVYNEGYVSGYASEITEDIPDGLEFLWSDKTGDELKNDTTFTESEKQAIEFNQSQLWELDATNENLIHTSYLAKENETIPNENLIEAFGENDDTNKKAKYKEVSVMLKVTSNQLGSIIRNEASITEQTDPDGNTIPDRDSDPDTWVKYEDDEDYDNIKIESFDLVLRKYIIGVSNDDKFDDSDKLLDSSKKYLREPSVDTSELDSDSENSSTTAKYNHPKNPVIVSVGEYVIYNLRVYNEGGADGYAAEIKDYLPKYLEYVDCQYNRTYGWTKVSDRIYKTDYLKDKLIEKRSQDNEKIVLNFQTVSIMLKVVNVPDNVNILTNIAEISKYKDSNNNEVTDRDSHDNNLNYPNDDKLPTYKDDETGTYIPGQEDDDDFEKIKVYKFDLALRKWVTESIVTVNGQTTTYKTNNQPYDDPENPAKVEIKKNQLNNTQVKWKYKIRVINQGNLAGYATQIKDRIPDGLKFDSADNPLWTEISPNVITTDQLKETLLEPGQYVDIEVILTWINSKDNMGTKVNWAEISEDKNKYNIPDIDSTPDNNVKGEDDIDEAPVLLSIHTGQARIFYGALFVLIPLSLILSILKIKESKNNLKDDFKR